MAAPANETEEPAPGPGKDVPALEAAPEPFQFGDTVEGRIAGKISAVDRADARSDDHVGFDPAFEECAQHADLNCAETPAAR